MSKAFLILFAAVVMCGCRSVPTAVTHGVPHLERFDAANNLWRGGQPDEAGWAYLASVGVRQVVKLNTYKEGDDTAAELSGMKVTRWPLDTMSQLGLTHFTMPQVEAFVPNTFVHCAHGQDRTGLAVACYRRQAQHWTKQRSESEMLAHGFHKTLRGLCEYWEAVP